MDKQLIVKNDLHPIIQMVIDSVSSPITKRKYRSALDEFLTWWNDNGRQPISKALVQRYLTDLHDQGVGSLNLRLSAIKKMVREAIDNGLLDIIKGQGVLNIKGFRKEGHSIGNWITKNQAQALLRAPDITTIKGLRDRAILAVFLGCGLRRSEVASLTFDHIQQRDGRWAVIDLVGKRNKTRSVPMPSWCKVAIDEYTIAAGLTAGHIFRPVNKGDVLHGEKMSDQSVYVAIQNYTDLAPHDLRRSFAKLAYNGGADLIQIQKSLGHSSVQVTEIYLGSEQDFTHAPCDVLGLDLN
ncbi:MAG: tyrosine-type recombinase/integrase [Anaerolineales bacterium]|jgi:site-specific recombinase XerD